MIKKKCIICNKEFYVCPARIKNKRGKFCSKECYYKSKIGHTPLNKGKKLTQYSGKNSFHWKGGKYITSQSYINILKPNHPFCDKQGYIKKSRLVMEKHLRRYLKPEEIVHHKGTKYPINSIENRQDDRLENLKLFANHKLHMQYEVSQPNNCSQKTRFKKGHKLHQLHPEWYKCK